ncbi:ubiquitin-conjugating enzyme E2 C-like [Pocillopora verrucosa]|uniref:ubiquitin-conjugating enzyme E2 C-like n=1 Tax=Pocillopora verrucosa TaxID=203993 RepID=UPI00333E6F5F
MACEGKVWARLLMDLKELSEHQDSLISAFPSGDGILEWIGTIYGGKDTVYDGKKYQLTLEFPSTYPHKPPVVKFKTPCYHPNVDDKGNICLDILKDKWTSAYGVRSILHSIQALLGAPNNDNPLNVDAAQKWNNKAVFKDKMREFECKYAITE